MDDAADSPSLDEAPGKRRTKRTRTIVSLVILVVVFGVVFPRLISYRDVIDSIRALGPGELTVLTLLTFGKWASEGLIYAAVLPSLGMRRGAVAYLSSTAAVNTVPGPVDLAVRYGMYRAWGYQLEAASAAVVSGGLFSTLSKLVLPAIAIVIANLSAYQQDGLGMYALIGIIVALGAIAFVITIFRSEQQARAVGDWFGRVATKVLRKFKRGPVTGVGDRLASVVGESSSVVRSRWPLAVGATVLANAFNYTVLLASLRFSGVPDDALPWFAIFVAFATVQFLTVVPITSGNVGISELVYIGTMGAVAGAAYRDQVAAGVFVYRIFTWLLVIPVGWVTMFVWQALQRRRGSRVDLLGGATS
jgi:uncharacterized membrane protein YbhN (UPF0104 family)